MHKFMCKCKFSGTRELWTLRITRETRYIHTGLHTDSSSQMSDVQPHIYQLITSLSTWYSICHQPCLCALCLGQDINCSCQIITDIVFWRPQWLVLNMHGNLLTSSSVKHNKHVHIIFNVIVRIKLHLH